MTEVRYTQADLEQARTLGAGLGTKAQERIAQALADRERAGRERCVQSLRDMATLAEQHDECEAESLRQAATALECLPSLDLARQQVSERVRKGARRG